MRIVIDLQGAQAVSAKRGIGRYSLSFTKALARNRGEHEVILALSAMFPATIESLRAEFEGLLPADAIRVWTAPGPVNSLTPENDWRRKAAELTREAFLASLDADVVVVSSLFEGLVDDAVTSIGTLGRTVPTAVILYDLIPMVHRSIYLGNPVSEAWYERKVDCLRRAGLVLTISEASRQEALKHLGLDADRVRSISTAADPQFRQLPIAAAREEEVRRRLGLERPFVMYTGGIDHRKNIEGLVRAYARLDRSLRRDHQLAVVCSVEARSRAELEALALEQGLGPDELVLTGFVAEADLIALYNLCKVFCFPSWHEGFGLPALEAMGCGRAVVAANSSSLPEVIGREDALFEPRSDEAITRMLTRVLTDDAFRAELERHGPERARRFSWDTTACTALCALEAWQARESRPPGAGPGAARRPRLAYVSPLPPERSGISDYSAELLPELARHYEIDVVVDQPVISSPWIRANCRVRTVDWFRENAGQYDRILYHLGNSHFHVHMFDLLRDFPGVVVLHDFFLSGIIAHLDAHVRKDYGWPRELYDSHGYAALRERFTAPDSADVVWKYPCNAAVLRDALGVIAHSEYSRRLAKRWYGSDAGWDVLPLLRVPVEPGPRADARRALGLADDAFLVCSLGLLGPTKLNHRLLDAWLASPLASDPNCVLVFVGENDGGAYGARLLGTIEKSGLGERIRISGWTDMAVFRQYLAAADVGVQLRTHSRGETSAAVLDCMNFGLATVVNSNGSLADLPDDGVLKISDAFTDAELASALAALRSDEPRRRRLGQRAREIVLTRHSPRECADGYARAIESMYWRNQSDLGALAGALASLEPAPADEEAWVALAGAVARSMPPRVATRQMFVDISELVQRDARTGIQRVVRSVLFELLLNAPEGWRIEPVYATTHHGYRYARRFTLRLLDVPDAILADEPIEFHPGDVFLGLDLQPHVVTAQAAFFQEMRRFGVRVCFVAYDLLPVRIPHAFAPGAADLHQKWLEVAASADAVACISDSVATDLAEWLPASGVARLRALDIGWFHLGADIGASHPSRGLPPDHEEVLREVARRPSFLMVGTVEPRKKHDQALAAFEAIWAEGADANLVVVGKQGWLVERWVEKVRAHPELGRRLFWLEAISDEYLERMYSASRCLIAASEGEGYGLPLIEAARRGLPILARDIPAFREVAESHAIYFSGTGPDDLAQAIRHWLALDAAGDAPRPESIATQTWAQCTQQLLDVVFGKRRKLRWMPDGTHHFSGASPRLPTQVGRREAEAVATTGKAGWLMYGPYVALPSGRYRIVIGGTLAATGTPPARVEAAAQSGSTILHSQPITSPGPDGAIAEFVVDIDSAIEDLEIRVWVGEDALMTISRLDIEPVRPRAPSSVVELPKLRSRAAKRASSRATTK